MNMIISAFVGSLVAASVSVAGVNTLSDDQKPVAKSELYTYSSQ